MIINDNGITALVVIAAMVLVAFVLLVALLRAATAGEIMSVLADALYARAGEGDTNGEYAANVGSVLEAPQPASSVITNYYGPVIFVSGEADIEGEREGVDPFDGATEIEIDPVSLFGELLAQMYDPDHVPDGAYVGLPCEKCGSTETGRIMHVSNDDCGDDLPTGPALRCAECGHKMAGDFPVRSRAEAEAERAAEVGESFVTGGRGPDEGQAVPTEG